MSKLSEKLPAKLKVGCYTYDVEVQDEVWRDKQGAYGWCDVEAKVINIADISCKESFINTVIHEIIHACYDLMGLTDKSKEEDVALGLGTALTMVLVDNPELLRLLNELAGGGVIASDIKITGES